MPKYLLLKHYRGGPEQYRPFPPMDEWEPEDVEAHMTFLRNIRATLQESGEYVDGQALTPERTWVRWGGPDAAPVTTEGPHPETSDLVAGWYMIDVDSYERALEVAAHVPPSPAPAVSRVRMDRRPRADDRLRRRRSQGPRHDRHDRATGRGRTARPRPARSRVPRATRRGLRRRRGRAAGGAARGASRLARASTS